MATKHNHGPNFGRRVDGCPRCAELAAGAEPIRQNRGSGRHSATDYSEMQRRATAAHFAPGGPHERGSCGPVCTFGDA